MKYKFNAIPLLITVLHLCVHCSGQTLVRLPYGLLRQFKAQCVFCRLHPLDSARIVAPVAGINNSLVSFHNSIVALVAGDLDSSYAYTLNTITHIDSVAYKMVYLYAYFIKAKILYYKKLFGEAAAGYQHLLALKPPDEVMTSNIYTNLGEIYMQQQNFTQALKYFNTWQELYTAGSDANTYQAVYRNKGLCFYYLGRHTEAEDSYLQSIQLGRQFHDTLALAITYANLANFYYNQMLDGKAIPCFQLSLMYAQAAHNIGTLKDATLNMAVVEENRNRFKAALVYRKKYEQLQDSIWNQDNIWKLAGQEKRFEAQLKENKILLLEQQAALGRSELKARNLQRNALFAAALGLLLFTGLAYNAYRLKARKNRLILKQKEELALLNTTKDKLYSVVAHDLRSPVFSLKTNLANATTALEQNNITWAGSAIHSARETAAATYALLDNLLHWALSQTGQLFFRPEKLQLAAIVKQVCQDYIAFAGLKNIAVHQQASENIYVQADINSLKIILRNLLDNAIKYTRAEGQIGITALQDGNRCCISVKDTGVGINEDVLSRIFTTRADKPQQDTAGFTGTGFGLGLCRLMAEKNNGKLQISSVQGQGTEVKVYLPLFA